MSSSYLLPPSTSSASAPLAHSESSLDAITVSLDEAPFLDRYEYGARFTQPMFSGFHVLWDLNRGLIVSPNVNRLPSAVPDPDLPQDNRTNFTPQVLTDATIYRLFLPLYVPNSGVLFGRLNLNRVALNAAIKPLNTGHLYETKFILSDEVVGRWMRLEAALIDIATTLLDAITMLPRVEFPKFPLAWAYNIPHKTHGTTFYCASRALEAFVELSALVSFAIALHIYPGSSISPAIDVMMRNSLSKPDRSWFDLLANSYACNFNPSFRVGGYINPYTSHWCNYIPRFANANVPVWVYWGHYHNVSEPAEAAARAYSPSREEVELARSRAQVTSTLILPNVFYHPTQSRPLPVRLSNYTTPMSRQEPTSSRQQEVLNYGPPSPSAFPLSENHLDDDYPMGGPASSPQPRQQEQDDDIMGTSAPAVSPQRLMPETPVRDSPHSPSPRPESPPVARNSEEEAAGKEEKALAALMKHFATTESVRQRRLAIETPKEKQQRESWEQHAETSKLFTHNSPVYEWRELPDGTYERVKLALAEVQDVWQNFTRAQRRYTGHTNSWDLCPQLPRSSEEFPESAEYYSDDDEEEPLYSRRVLPLDDALPVPPLDDPSSVLGNDETESPPDQTLLPRSTCDNVYNDDLVRLTQIGCADAVPAASPVEKFNLKDYIQNRFGYNIFSPAGWTTKIAPSLRATNISFKQAMMVLSCNDCSPADDVQAAVVNLVKVLSNSTWTFHHLPSAFDHTDDRGLSLHSDKLQITLIHDGDLMTYLISNKGFINHSPWGILVADASTVLLVFRHRWDSMSVIARELTKIGVPFHTVQAVDARSIKRRAEPVQGLGTRPEKYKATPAEYAEYLRRRKDLLLTGSKGRAALMHGGIVARIAREVLDSDYHTVLDGPSNEAVTVGSHGRFNLYDDVLTENDTDIICGVYFVETGSSKSKQASSTGEHPDGTLAHMSFWPKVATWNATAGYIRAQWTEKAETYYQKRKALIEKTFELLSASKWRTVLRTQNALREEVETGAEHYQTGYLEDFCRRTSYVARRH